MIQPIGGNVNVKDYLRIDVLLLKDKFFLRIVFGDW